VVEKVAWNGKPSASDIAAFVHDAPDLIASNIASCLRIDSPFGVLTFLALSSLSVKRINLFSLALRPMDLLVREFPLLRDLRVRGNMSNQSPCLFPTLPPCPFLSKSNLWGMSNGPSPNSIAFDLEFNPRSFAKGMAMESIRNWDSRNYHKHNNNPYFLGEDTSHLRLIKFVAMSTRSFFRIELRREVWRASAPSTERAGRPKTRAGNELARQSVSEKYQTPVYGFARCICLRHIANNDADKRRNDVHPTISQCDSTMQRKCIGGNERKALWHNDPIQTGSCTGMQLDARQF
jgi:hypothetical protein